MRYTFSDDEEDSDDFPSRRSTRNFGVSIPVEHTGPIVTASGRQVKSRLGGMYGESMLVGQPNGLENGRAATTADGYGAHQDEASSRPQRSTRLRRPTRAPRRIGESAEDMGSTCDGGSSGNEWGGDEEHLHGTDAEEFEADGEDVDEEMSANDSEMDGGSPLQDSLVVQLRYRKRADRTKVKGRWGDENGDGAATADCIAVGLCHPPDDTVHLDEEAPKDEGREGNVQGHFQELPANSIRVASSPQFADTEKKGTNTFHSYHEPGLRL